MLPMSEWVAHDWRISKSGQSRMINLLQRERQCDFHYTEVLPYLSALELVTRKDASQPATSRATRYHDITDMRRNGSSMNHLAEAMRNGLQNPPDGCSR